MVKWLYNYLYKYIAWNKITRPIPLEVRRKISRTLKGRRWRPIRLCPICGKDAVRSGRKFCSTKCFGLSRRGKKTWIKGKKHTKATCEKISISKRGKKPHNYGKPNYAGRGKNCHLWKGGITKKSIQIRMSLEYKNWRRAVFERDDFTCQRCKRRGGNLYAHHIKDFATYPELRFDISNGITLCLLCHKKTDNYPKNLRYATV